MIFPNSLNLPSQHPFPRRPVRVQEHQQRETQWGGDGEGEGRHGWALLQEAEKGCGEGAVGCRAVLVVCDCDLVLTTF